jgi:orotidine-5'-phosphate decarboxylase
MSTGFADRLRARRAAIGSALCVGIDPHPDALPAGLPRDVHGIESFARGLIEATAPFASAVKVNLAFFEAFGAEGWAVLERVRADVPPDLACVLDAKRGDIGSTAERYAEALAGRFRADAVTLSPYLGEDAIEPFLAHPNLGVYILARTSNPSAARVQGLEAEGLAIHLHVAHWVAERWPGGRAGLVVGATAPDEMASIREAVPGPAFLVPGVGAQGGDLEAAVRHADGSWAPGLVSVSRAIAGASSGPDWQAAAAGAARELGRRMADAVLHSGTSPAPAASSEVRE